jgi:transposase
VRDGQQNGALLWAEIRQRGFDGSRTTFYRWLAARRQKAPVGSATSQRRAPSRRVCAWLLGEEPSALDESTRCFLHHLSENAPGLLVAGGLARRFAALIRGDDEKALDQWIDDAAGTELDALAKGIRRDLDAVKAAITHPWSISPVEGRINRLETLKRQMYGRAGYELLRSRLLAAA